jgi:hypothetical protein
MASPAEITDEIERLAAHCRPPLMDVNQRVLWLEDWCSDLKSFPIEAIRAACTKWRHGEDRKFPTAGQMRGLCMANTPGKPTPSGLYEPWRELSDAEYEALGLNNKIRHHEILAAEAGRKAGPFRLDAPEPARPEAHAVCRPRQQAHHDEAARLRSRKRLMDQRA